MFTQNVVYAENYAALKKNKILIHATTKINLGNIMLNEMSQTHKDKYYMIPLT